MRKDAGGRLGAAHRPQASGRLGCRASQLKPVSQSRTSDFLGAGWPHVSAPFTQGQQWEARLDTGTDER